MLERRPTILPPPFLSDWDFDEDEHTDLDVDAWLEPDSSPTTPAPPPDDQDAYWLER
jgi:hypothetical protein